jgi:hypothetical protein
LLVQLSSAPLAELSASLEILYQVPIPISMPVPMTMPVIEFNKMLALRVPEDCHHASTGLRLNTVMAFEPPHSSLAKSWCGVWREGGLEDNGEGVGLLLVVREEVGRRLEELDVSFRT